MNATHDPRLLEPPSYWDDSYRQYEVYCEMVCDHLATEYGIKKNADEIENNFYVKCYCENGYEPYEAADALVQDIYEIQEAS